MKKRVLAGLTVILIVLLAFVLPVQYFYILFFILALLCCHEYMNMLETSGIRPLRIIGYIWTGMFTMLLFNIKYGIVGTTGLSGGYEVMLAATLLLMTLATASVFSRNHDLKSAVHTFFGCIYTVFLLGFAVLIIELPMGKWLLGYVILGGVATDTFSYFTGYFFGKKKIVPSISPAKTVEGSIGGYIGSVLVILVYTLIMKAMAGWIPPIPAVLFIMLVSGAAAQVGDWVASYIKRHFGIKDFGRLIPGHGGMLDRIDSIIFLAPLIYLVLII
ncbi:MAG: phosphatidate cytidylyltransferase [Clostridia bacterium]|nr:phosphatidate cytidylyltransferase [Clostridia bacterium]